MSPPKNTAALVEAAREPQRRAEAAAPGETSHPNVDELLSELQNISDSEEDLDSRAMAENVPPNSGQNNTTSADQPGRPYYESLRVNLRQILDKKRKLDEQLAAVEEQIFKAEGNYLEETANSGNIVRGFDGWVKGVQIGGRGGADDRRRGRVRDEDRVFSRSSVSWMRAQDGIDSNPTSHAATPTASFAPQISARDGGVGGASASIKAQNKKKRPTDRDEDEDSKGVKRGKITYSRD